MRVWMPLMMIVAVALSGCAGEEALIEATDDAAGGDGAPADDDVSPDGGPDTDGTPGAVEDLVPVLSVSADAVNGTAPLLVQFEVSAEDDSEDLIWAFLIDGNETLNGTSLPASFNHTFQAGLWNITILVDDGTHVVEEELSIDVVVAEILPQDPVSFTGTISGLYAADPFVGAGVGYITDPVTHTFEVTQVADAIDFVLAWDSMGYDLDFNVIAPDGTEVAGAANYNDPIIGDNAQSESATLEDAAALAQLGTWTIEVLSAGSYESEYTFDITFS